MADSSTALERALSSTDRPARVTPLDALRAARRVWLQQQRIDMGALAAQLGVSRATLYNWVGDRERLTAEVMWSIAERTIEDARRQVKGTGAEHLSAVVAYYLTALAGFEPTRKFIERDPEFALRVLAGSRTPFQRRLIEANREMIEAQMAACGYEPPLDPGTLAYLLVRIGESFIFNSLITGDKPDLQKAIQASRVLLHAPPLPD